MWGAMGEALLPVWSGVSKPLIAMLHLPPLPGSPRYGGDMQTVHAAVLNDAQALADAGVHGLLLENFGDSPFFRGRVAAYTVAHMTALAWAVRQQVALPLGINVLRNDAQSALAIAAAVEASFIRVNVLQGAMLTDQGLIEGCAAELMRDRAMLGAGQVKVLADVRVKHARPLVEQPLAEEVEDLLRRAHADGLIVTGSGTGRETDPVQVQAVKQAAGDAAVWVGSGVTEENIVRLAPYADGFIVGTYLKKGGQVFNAVDPQRVRKLMAQLA